MIRIGPESLQIRFVAEQVDLVAEKDAMFATSWNHRTLLGGDDRIAAGNDRAIAIRRRQELLLFLGSGEEVRSTTMNGAKPEITRAPLVLHNQTHWAPTIQTKRWFAAGAGIGRR